MNPAIGGARSRSHDSQSFWSQTVDPLAGSDRWPSVRVGPLCGSITVALDLFVGNRSLHDKNEGLKLSAFGLVEMFHEIVADFIGENGIVQIHLGQAGN